MLDAALPEGTLSPPEPRHLEEPRGRYHGQAGTVARPRSTGEVSTILAACNAAQVPVIPYSGGTGLVGGQLTEGGPAPVLLSLERMTAIRAVDPLDNTLTCEGGTILADIQAAAEGVDRLFPLSLASEGSCRIGGNLATNAGGVNVLRYGNTRDLCLGVEAVLADGTVVQGLKRLRKDNTGYDLRHLLIGSEGTLGVITAATLRLFPRPAEQATALCALRDLDAALELLNATQKACGETLSAFELMERTGFEMLAEKLPQIPVPLESPGAWNVLIDLGGSGVSEALERVLETAFEDELITDAVLAQNEAQRYTIWQIREQIPEANRLIGSIVSNDISVPVSSVPSFVRAAGQKLRAFDDSIRINAFGHLGDGNLHYNLFPAQGRSRDSYDNARSALKEIVTEEVMRHEGSFSAEHGVGRLKVAELEHYGDPGKLAAMRAIKAALDPNGILNPGAVLAGSP
ncbi:MAG: FAD-binding oxidoreductase [Pseudomonadota bacterium]